MGVPKFFRWLYERYPCLCEVVREYEIPEFDNLYLDMNGIIHTCSHPNDFDPLFRISEEKIFKDIFHYIEILFRMIQPRKLFFMAVDGVAPRAKLNQQRGRRFRTAKEAIELEKKAVDNGDVLPKDKRFDSNCITPGTEFMERLQHQLRYFIADKMSNDKLWKNLKVVLSGHETPGEGEHKIMDYIRYMKSQPDYDHNTRHCLYGLDADLIMLGLCTHEPHFSLLREEVKFGKKAKRSTMPEGTKFYLLHLSVMRGYLDWEFSSLKDKLPFGYDIESIIDDWVLMGFLVGNDFIPHLPGLHIANGALQILHKAYMDVLPTLGGYINEGGTLELSRFQRYMEKLAAFDINQFKDEYADLKYFEGKTGRKMGGCKERPKFFNSPDEISSMDPKLQEMISFTEKVEEMAIAHDRKDEDLEQLFGGIEDDLEEDDEDDDDDDGPIDPAMFQEFFQKKRDYYTNKLDFEKVTPEVLRSQAEGYVRAIQWNLNYYYNGVCSWSWFYPHHYAPYISDIKNFCDLDIQFEMGKPFLPFQQLLAVLPSLSKDLLPKAFHSLMEDENSPIIDYYPTAFQTDLNGKRQEWEAVVLIPFIDEGRLLAAMDPLEDKLTEDEKRRNKHGPMHVYTYSGKSVGSFEAPHFPKIHSNHALEKRVSREEIHVPIEQLVKGLCPNVLLNVHFPGIPSLRHVPHKASLEKGKVKVFESPSRNESMIIEILNDEIIKWKKDTAVIAKELLGHSFLVSWPHLRESKVIEVLDRKSTYSLTSNSKTKGQANDSKSNVSKLQLKIDATNEDKFKLEENSIREEFATHLGIKLGPISVIIHSLPLAGWKYAFTSSGGVTLEKQWGSIHSSIALQTVVKDIKIMGPKITECNTIHEMFPPKTTVFLLSNPHYGSMGRVTDIIPAAAAGKVALVQISLDVVPEPDMDTIRSQLTLKGMKYYPGGVAAQRVGISGHLLSRVTGTIFISQSNTDAFSKATNIGLSLKFNKRNEEVPGYTKKDYHNTWLYSEKCIELLGNYCEKFPDVFHFLSENTRSNEFQEAAVFPNSSTGGTTLKEVVDWLSKQPHSQVEHRKCGTETLDEDIVLGIENEIEKVESIVMDKKKKITMKVQPHLLYKPGFKMGYMQPDRTTKYYLYDRVTNVRECFTVPLGLRGTVMGIHRSDRPEDTLYDIVFDSPFDGGASIGGCSHGKGYRLPAYALINLSHGARSLKGGNMDIVAVSKTNSQVASCVLPSGNILTRYSNPFAGISDLDGSKTVEHHSRVPDRPASAFASWRSGCTGFGPNIPLSNIPTKDGNPDDISSGPPPKLDSSFKGRDTTILKRPAPNQLPALQLQQPPDQLQPTNCSVEFQAMWKELQKSGGNTPSAKTAELKPSGAFPFVLGVNQLPTAQVPISDQVKDSGTDFLKKILRIDSNPSPLASVSTVAQPAPQNITSPAKEINQPSVLDFFEKAKAAKQQEQNQQNQKGQQNNCLKLISMYQRTGLGIPRYDYVMIENGMIIANLSMPNSKVLQGEPANTREKASENVAKLAIAQMSNWPKQDVQFSALPANKLPAPPQQWYQQGSHQMSQQQHMMPFQNQASWQHGNMYQKLNWRDNPDQANEWRRRTANANGQWQGIRPQSNQPVFPQTYVQPHYAFNSFPQYQGQQPHAPPASWSNNSNHPLWRQPPNVQCKPPEPMFPPGVNGPAVSNPFVPLQAVRAQMSAHSHQVQLPKKQNNDVQKNDAVDDAKNTEQTREVILPSGPKNNSCEKEVTAASESVQVDSEKQSSAESASEEIRNDNKRPSNSSETISKTRETKPVYVPPHARKSRLAINFGKKE